MRTHWIAILVLSVSLPALAWAADGDRAEDKPAPDFVLKSLSGPNLRLSEYRGEVVMVVFWASWCGECRGQLKALNDLHAAYGGSGLRILAVNLDRKMPDARETAGALGVNYSVLHDPQGEVAELFGARDVPFAVFIDREGRAREAIEGYDRADEELFVERLRNLLRE